MDSLLIGQVLGLATEIFKFLNTKEAKKYLDESTEVRLELDAELRKDMADQDDGKIEELRAHAVILGDAARAELELARADS